MPASIKFAWVLFSDPSFLFCHSKIYSDIRLDWTWTWKKENCLQRLPLQVIFGMKGSHACLPNIHFECCPSWGCPNANTNSKWNCLKSLGMESQFYIIHRSFQHSASFQIIQHHLFGYFNCSNDASLCSPGRKIIIKGEEPEWSGWVHKLWVWAQLCV